MDRHDRNLRADERRKIRELNDALRCRNVGGRKVYTQALLELDSPTLLRVMHAVSEFDRFNSRNDPKGEHDRGEVLIDAVRYSWEIQYYDLTGEHTSPNPADETVTCRVLTIAVAERG